MSYSTCNFTREIDENECIGDSLTTINSNFSALDVAVCNLSQTLSINDSPTIDLTLTPSRVLSADVKDLAISTAKIASEAVSYSKIGPDLRPSLAKAWVSFNAFAWSGSLGSNPAYNISSVVKNSQGDYTINFASPISNYCVVATCHEWVKAGNNTAVGYYVWTQPYNYTSTSVSIRHHTYSKTTTEADPPAVGVVIFAL
jgi:hypothetical protein